MAAILLIEDRPWRSAGGTAVRDTGAARAAERGAGEPKCAAFWGDRAFLTDVSTWLVR